MSALDYSQLAEVYPSRSHFKSRHVGYRRFGTAGEAIRYIIEELPPDMLRGTLLEVGELRFEGNQVRALYDADAYPLARRAPAVFRSQAGMRALEPAVRNG